VRKLRVVVHPVVIPSSARGVERAVSRQLALAILATLYTAPSLRPRCARAPGAYSRYTTSTSPRGAWQRRTRSPCRVLRGVRLRGRGCVGLRMRVLGGATWCVGMLRVRVGGVEGQCCVCRDGRREIRRLLMRASLPLRLGYDASTGGVLLRHKALLSN
jgi:hypothetical protein